MAASNLVVKRTFLEFAVNEEESEPSYAHLRRQTEPANGITDFLKDEGSDEEDSATTREPSSGSSSADTPSKTVDASPCNTAHPAFTVLPTPEATPMFGPQSMPYGPHGWAGPGMMPPMMGMDYFTLPEQYNMELGADWWPPVDLGFNRTHPGSMPPGCEFECGPIAFGDFMLPDGQLNPQAYGALAAMNPDHQLPQDMFSQTAAPQDLGTIPNTASNVTPTNGGKETRTTVMIRNLPEGYTRANLLECLNKEGFFGRFDFIYVPIDFKRRVNLGYAFINLISSNEAQRFCRHFEGFNGWGQPSDTACTVSWSNPHQGLSSHIERYRNSPVMHDSVPLEWRPLLFKHGVEVPFPPPTKNIKAPKVKSAS